MYYAIIHDGIVINVVVCDDQDFAELQGWVVLDEGYWIDDLWSADGGFAKSS